MCGSCCGSFIFVKLFCAFGRKTNIKLFLFRWKPTFKDCISIIVHTYLTVGAQVTGSGAVTNVTVPALFAETSITTGGTAAPFLQLPGAEAADTHGALDLCQTADVTALAVDEEVTDTANVAVVEECCPDFWGQNELRLGLRQPTQVHITVQVQDLTALWGAEGHTTTVHWDRSWNKKHKEALQRKKVTLNARVDVL